MVNQQLLDYVKQQIEQGVTSDVIKQSLITSGWQETDVNEAFTALAPTAPVVQVPTPPISTIPQSDANPSKKRKWVKSVVITIVILITLIGTFRYLPHILNLFTKDITEPEYSDLQLQKVVVNDNDNAYYDLQKIEKVLYYPKEASTTISNMVSGNEWDDKFAEEFISSNKETFDYLRQANLKSKFQYPQLANPVNISVTTSGPSTFYLNVMRAQAIHALYLARKGKTEEALNESFVLISVSQKIKDSQAPLISYLIAMAMNNVGLITVQNILSKSTLTTEELRVYSNNLNQYSNNKEEAIEALKVENHINIASIEGLYSNISESKIPFKSLNSKSNFIYLLRPNKTKKLFIDDTRSKIKSLDALCSEQPQQPEGLLPLSDKELKKMQNNIFFSKIWFTENSIGRILFTSLYGPTGPSLNCKVANPPFKATQAMFAIKEFKNNTGTLPSSLNELVPNYLPSVPVDPYDGNPMRYSKEKKIVYFVGTSTEDIGGSEGNTFDWPRMKNPTFKFDF